MAGVLKKVRYGLLGKVYGESYVMVIWDEPPVKPLATPCAEAMGK